MRRGWSVAPFGLMFLLDPEIENGFNLTYLHDGLDLYDFYLLRMHRISFDFSPEQYQDMVSIVNEYYPMYPTHESEIRAEDHNKKGKELHRYLFESNGSTVGFAELSQTTWTDDPHSFTLDIFVRKDLQRQGLGKSIYEKMLQIQTSAPIKTLEASSSSLIEGGQAFLEQYGFELATVEHVSAINFSTWTSAPFLQTLKAVEEQHIRFISYNDLAGFGYSKKDLHVLLSTLDHDIPWHVPHNPETYDQWHHRRTSDDRVVESCSFVALTQTGKLIGVSELETRPNAPKFLYQGLTGVLPSFRRRGIAFALKVTSFQMVQKELPHMSTIWTENEKNNPMYVLNTKLGFERQFDWLSLQKSL